MGAGFSGYADFGFAVLRLSAAIFYLTHFSPRMLIHVWQHVAHEGPGLLADWAAARGHALRQNPVFEAASPLPDVAAGEGLVVLGGPMSVHDEAALPWLRAEKAGLKTALAAGRPVLGICLGAQLLVEALGGQVTAGADLEIGWFPVRLTAAARALPLMAPAPTEITVLHWHGETCSLPPGAVPLGRSLACENQGFSWNGQALGLQFHPEINDFLLAEMLRYEGHELAGGGRFVQSAEELTAGLATHGSAARAWLFGVLDGLFASYEPLT